MPRRTERIIQLLETVNATAVNNDDGKPGEFLAEPCTGGGRSPPRADDPLTVLVEGVLGLNAPTEGTEGSTPRALRQKDDGISRNAHRSALLCKPDSVTGRQKREKSKDP
jgi:hypothetical protein